MIEHVAALAHLDWALGITCSAFDSRNAKMHCRNLRLPANLWALQCPPEGAAGLTVHDFADRQRAKGGQQQGRFNHGSHPIFARNGLQ
jgi:hypothetical protein